MKSVYIMYDVVAKEIVNAFHAASDEHATQILQNELQRNPMNIKIKVFKACDVEIFEDKNIMVSSNCGTYDTLFEYPQTKSIDPDLLKENINSQGE